MRSDVRRNKRLYMSLENVVCETVGIFLVVVLRIVLLLQVGGNLAWTCEGRIMRSSPSDQGQDLRWRRVVFHARFLRTSRLVGQIRVGIGPWPWNTKFNRKYTLEFYSVRMWQSLPLPSGRKDSIDDFTTNQPILLFLVIWVLWYNCYTRSIVHVL